MLKRHKCDVCAAKDQTITLLADLVDWHRAQMNQVNHASSMSLAANPMPEYSPATWASDEEEDIIAALESGVLDTEAAERALASIQAQNTTITLVK